MSAPAPSTPFPPPPRPQRIVCIHAPHVPPSPLRNFPTNVDRFIGRSHRTTGISLRQHARLSEEGYQRTWMQELGLPATILDGFVSGLKMEVLCREDALEMGDVLYVGAHPERVAQITDIPSSGYQRPELTLYYNGVQTATLDACIGPGDLVPALEAMAPQEDWRIREKWKAVLVRRGNLELGSLYHIRQSLHRWTMEMDACKGWKARNEGD